MSFFLRYSLQINLHSQTTKTRTPEEFVKNLLSQFKADVRNHRYLSSLISDVENIQYTVLLFSGIPGQI